MKIAFSGQPLLEKEKTGIGYYTEGLVKHIIKQHPQNEYFINAFSYKRPEEAKETLLLYKSTNTRVNVCRFMPLKIYKLIWNIFPIPYYVFFREKADITHFFNYYIPPFVRGKKITTIHDMTIKTYPETVRLTSRVMAKLNLRTTCKRATRIITSSEFSKSEIVKYLKVSPEKISVLYSGVDLNVYKPCKDEDAKERIKHKYGISKEYYLYLGTLEPRKNIERLILAYSMLKEESKDIPKLVIAGKKGWMYEDIFNVVSEKNLKKHVIFTGYVDSEDAPILMSAAVAFVFPSLYEGFGMPPLEAMACGTPVITSNCASLPEVVGDAAILVNPYSVEEIMDALKQVYVDKEVSRILAKRGEERAKLFAWDKISHMLYEIYKEVMRNEHGTN